MNIRRITTKQKFIGYIGYLMCLPLVFEDPPVPTSADDSLFWLFLWPALIGLSVIVTWIVFDWWGEGRQQRAHRAWQAKSKQLDRQRGARRSGAARISSSPNPQ